MKLFSRKGTDTYEARKSFWDNVVDDERERKVFEVLSRPETSWYSLGYIMQETGLDEPYVRGILNLYSQLVKKWPFRAEGQEYFALQNAGGGLRELLARAKSFLEFKTYLDVR